MQKSVHGDESFTATIQRLRGENHHLCDEINHLRGQLEEVSRLSCDWKSKNWQLQRDLVECRRLKEELERELKGARGCIHEAIQVLRKHQSPLNDSEKKLSSTEERHRRRQSGRDCDLDSDTAEDDFS